MESKLCYICGKTFKCLLLHLSNVHKCDDCILIPKTLREFMHLLVVLPKVKINRKLLKAHLQTDKDLPIKVFQTIHTAFKKYTRTGVKPILQLGEYKRQHRRRVAKQVPQDPICVTNNGLPLDPDSNERTD